MCPTNNSPSEESNIRQNTTKHLTTREMKQNPIAHVTFVTLKHFFIHFVVWLIKYIQALNQSRYFLCVCSLFSTTRFGLLIPLSTPQGRRLQQLKWVLDSRVRGNFGKPIQGPWDAAKPGGHACSNPHWVICVSLYTDQIYTLAAGSIHRIKNN